MRQQDLIQIYKDRAPLAALGLTDKQIWGQMQSQYPELKAKPYREIKPPKNVSPQLKADADYDSFSPGTVQSITDSAIDITEAFSLPEKMLGKGKAGALFKSMSDAIGVSPEFWKYAYTNSLTGMAYATLHGKQKYNIEEYAESADWKADAGSFFAGIFQPLDMGVFAISGGIGGLARGGVSNLLAKSGLNSLIKNTAIKRGVTHGIIGSAESAVTLGAYSGAGAALAESSRQSTSGEKIDMKKILGKGAHGYLEGAAIGAISGGLTKGTLGAKYGSALIKSGDKTFGNKVTKIMAHPLTGQTGLEALAFTSVPVALGMEGAPVFGSDEFWGELAKNTVIIGTMRGWSGITSRGRAFGKDGEEIINQAFKQANESIKKNNQSVETVKKELLEVGVDIEKVAGMNDALVKAYTPESKKQELNNLKVSLRKFNEVQDKLNSGEIPEPEKRTEAQNKEVADALKVGVFLDQVFRGILEKWKGDETLFYDALKTMHNKEINPTQFEMYKKELDKTINNMNNSAREKNEAVLNPKTEVPFVETKIDYSTLTDRELIRLVSDKRGISFGVAEKEFTLIKETERPGVPPLRQKVFDRDGIIKYLKAKVPEPKEGFKEITHEEFVSVEISGISKKRKRQLDSISEVVDNLKVSGVGNFFESSRNVIAYIVREILPKRKGGPGGRADIPLSTKKMKEHVENMGELASFLAKKEKDFYTMDKQDIVDFLYNKSDVHANTINLLIEYVGKYNEGVRGLTKPDITAEAGSIKDPIKGARKDYINFDEGTITFIPSKSGGTPAKIPITEKFVQMLKSLISRNKKEGKEFEFIDMDGESHNFLFWTEQKTPVKNDALNKILETVSAGIGKKMTQKQFRKAFGSWAQGNNVNNNMLKMIDRIGLAHKSGDLKKIYQLFSEKEFAEYRELQKRFMDEIFEPNISVSKNKAKDFATTWELKKIIENIRGIKGDLKVPGGEKISKETAIDIIRYQLETNARGVEGLPDAKYLEFINFERPGVRVPVKETRKIVGKPLEGIKELETFLNKYVPENKGLVLYMKESGRNKDAVGEYYRGIINLALGKATPHTFFHENAHRHREMVYATKNKKLIKLWERGEDIFRKEKKRDPEEGMADAIADAAVKLHEGGRLTKFGQWVRRFMAGLKQFFGVNRLSKKDIAAVLGKKVKEGFEYQVPSVPPRQMTIGNSYDIPRFGISKVLNMKTKGKTKLLQLEYMENGKTIKKWVPEFKIKSGNIAMTTDKIFIKPHLVLNEKGKLVRVIGGTPKFKFESRQDAAKQVRKHFNELFKDYALGQADKRSLINEIAKMAEIVEEGKIFTLKGADEIQLETFYQFLSGIDIAKTKKKKDIIDWFRTYNITEDIRLKANVNEKYQSEILKEVLGVRDGDIFHATKEQLDSYLDILHTMDYEKRTPETWVNDKLMVDYLPDDIIQAFTKSKNISKLTMPVWKVLEGMGLKPLSHKLKNHASIEYNHVGEFVFFEHDAMRIAGGKWKKWRDNLYLFDWARYNEKKLAGTLTKSEKNFIENATTKEWRENGKVSKESFTDTKEGKFGLRYYEYTKYFPEMVESIVESHMNKAEFEKWKKKNNIKWIKENVYVSRMLTENFKKKYNPSSMQINEIVNKSAVNIAREMAQEKYKSDYKGHIEEFMLDAKNIAWAELNDMMNYAPGKLSSRFLKKRHIKLPEEIMIDGKKIKVYESEYEKTQVRYSSGMSKYMATLEMFPEYAELAGFKYPGQKAEISKLKALDKNNGIWVEDQVKHQLGIGKSNHEIKPAKALVQFYSGFLAKVGLSFPTSGLKNFLLGSVQTSLAFNVRDFALGFAEATMSPSARRALKRTGATELGMRIHEELKTFRFIDKKLFKLGGMKITENLNRYIALLAGRRDQARMIKVLQTAKEGSRKYTRALKRMEGFYFLSAEEINMLKRYGFGGVDGAKMKDVFESASEKRKLNNIYGKMDTYAHVNTQGSSSNIFMPYWAQGTYARPLTLYKRMAYAASINTVRNINNAYETGNLTRIAAMGLGTYFSGETLMYVYDKLLGTTAPTENEDFWNSLAITLWRGEFFGILSEFLNVKGIWEGDISMSVYPAIYNNAGALIQALSGVWGDTMTHSQALDFYGRRTVGFYGGIQKIRERGLLAPTNYNKQKIRFGKLANNFREDTGYGLDDKTERDYIATVRSKWYKALSDAWNMGNKKEFKRMYWITYFGIADSYFKAGRDPNGGFINSWDMAFKKAQSDLSRKMKYLNPNRYSITKDSPEGRNKANKFYKWLANITKENPKGTEEGRKRRKELIKLESQFWHKMSWWTNQGFMESIKENNLMDMYREYDWKAKP